MSEIFSGSPSLDPLSTHKAVTESPALGSDPMPDKRQQQKGGRRLGSKDKGKRVSPYKAPQQQVQRALADLRADKRTALCQRFDQHVRELNASLPHEPNAAEEALIARAAHLMVRLDISDVLLSRGVLLDLRQYALVAGILAKVLANLGLTGAKSGRKVGGFFDAHAAAVAGADDTEELHLRSAQHDCTRRDE